MITPLINGVVNKTYFYLQADGGNNVICIKLRDLFRNMIIIFIFLQKEKEKVDRGGEEEHPQLPFLSLPSLSVSVFAVGITFCLLYQNAAC